MREKWRIMCVLFSSPIPDPQSHSTARYPLPRFEFLGRQSHCLLRLLLLSLVSLSGSAGACCKSGCESGDSRGVCVCVLIKTVLLQSMDQSSAQLPHAPPARSTSPRSTSQTPRPRLSGTATHHAHIPALSPTKRTPNLNASRHGITEAIHPFPTSRPYHTRTSLAHK